MKLLDRKPDFTPITVVIESRDEALRLAAAVLGAMGSDDTRLLERFGHRDVKAGGAPLEFSNLIMDALGAARMSR